MPTLRAVAMRIVPATGTGTPVALAGANGPGGPAGGGIGLGLLSAMCFGTSGTFGAALEGAGWSPAGAVLARVLVRGARLTVPALFALRGRGGCCAGSARQVVVYGLVGVARARSATSTRSRGWTSASRSCSSTSGSSWWSDGCGCGTGSGPGR